MSKTRTILSTILIDGLYILQVENGLSLGINLICTLAESTYKAMERRYRKAEKQCARAWAAEGRDSMGRDSLSCTGTGTIAVIQAAALLAVFAVLEFAVKRFGRYHSRYRSDNVWTGAKRAADICGSLGPSPSTVLLLYVYNGCSSNTCMACG